jgi:hypothetical protein
MIEGQGGSSWVETDLTKLRKELDGAKAEVVIATRRLRSAQTNFDLADRNRIEVEERLGKALEAALAEIKQ